MRNTFDKPLECLSFSKITSKDVINLLVRNIICDLKTATSLPPLVVLYSFLNSFKHPFNEYYCYLNRYILSLQDKKAIVYIHVQFVFLKCTQHPDCFWLELLVWECIQHCLKSLLKSAAWHCELLRQAFWHDADVWFSNISPPF